MSTARVVLIDDADGRLVADFVDDDAIVLHLRAIQFSKDKLAYYRSVFDEFLEKFRSLGYKKVYAAPYSNNAWAMSLCRAFGFIEHHRVRDGEFVVMQREI